MSALLEDAIHTIDRLTIATILLLCCAAFSLGFSVGMKIALNKIDSFQSRLKHLEGDALWRRRDVQDWLPRVWILENE